jgi:ABC-type sugar transport system permease subunit
MKSLYLTSTILSMIWTLGDFNSVYLLTGGGPADLTHVLATLGIRYLRLDQIDLAMASIVVALPLGAAAGLLHDEEVVQMSRGLTWRKVSTEAQLLLVGIPVLLWTLMPVYHMFLFAISERDQATSGRLWPKNPTLQNFDIVFQQKHFYLNHFWQQLGNSLMIAVAVGVITLFVATWRPSPSAG